VNAHLAAAWSVRNGMILGSGAFYRGNVTELAYKSGSKVRESGYLILTGSACLAGSRIGTLARV
jgi:hypothetical protein